MNLSDITSVQQLLEANNTKPELDDYQQGKEMLKQIYKLDPAYGRAICIHVMENLLGLHCRMAEQNAEAGDVKYALLWQTDATRIDNAITLLKDVQLKTDDGDDVLYDKL